MHDRSTPLAILLASALLLGGFLTTRSADAGTASVFLQCMHMTTGKIIRDEKSLENGKADLTPVPEGWTPVGGYGHPTTGEPVTVFCR